MKMGAPYAFRVLSESIILHHLPHASCVLLVNINRNGACLRARSALLGRINLKQAVLRVVSVPLDNIVM